MNVWEWVMDNPILLIMIPIGIIETYLVLWLKKRGLLFFKPINQKNGVSDNKDDDGNPNWQRGEIRDANTNKQDKDKTSRYYKIVFGFLVCFAHIGRIIAKVKS